MQFWRTISLVVPLYQFDLKVVLLHEWHFFQKNWSLNFFSRCVFILKPWQNKAVLAGAGPECKGRKTNPQMEKPGNCLATHLQNLTSPWRACTSRWAPLQLSPAQLFHRFILWTLSGTFEAQQRGFHHQFFCTVVLFFSQHLFFNVLMFEIACFLILWRR